MRRLICTLTLVVIALLALVPVANAANRRVAISNYAWTDTEIEIDLGEHVTWYWVGPDLMHSVTGTSANAAGIDTDPGTNQPKHELGDTFRVTFDQPGTYTLACKLHTTVKGTVTVSSTPGDPVTEPDPIPQSRVDATPPRLRELRMAKSTLGRRGTNLSFSLGERSRVSTEFFRLSADGERRFAGYRTFKGYIGFNGVRIAGPSKHFRPRPGSYEAVITATDEANNTSKPRRLRFTIRKR